MAIATLTGSGWLVPDPAAINVVPGGGLTGEVLTKSSPIDADVAWAAGGAAVIADGSIGSIKLAPLATKTYLGRTSAGTGSVEAVPAATVLTDLNAQTLLVSGTTIKTINGATILGFGNLVTGTGDAFAGNPLSQFAATTSAQLAGVLTDETGTGANVFATSPTLVTPALGTPSSVVLTNATAVPAGQITGVIPIANLATGTPNGTKFIRDDNTLQVIAGGGDAFVANPLSQFAATTSAQLLGVMSDETGTGALVFSTSPTLVTPDLGTPTALTLTNATGLPVAGGGTGRATSTTAYALLAAGTTATGAQQTLASGATTTILVGGGAAALPIWTTATGSGAPVRATSPALVTPDLGTPSAAVLTNATGLPVAGGGTGRATSTTAYGLIAAGTTATGAHQTLAAGLTSAILVGGGASALPVWTAASGTGSPVRNTDPAFLGNPIAPTKTQGNNSDSLATTAYVDTGLATKADALSQVTLGSGTTAITRAGHANRPVIVNQAGATTGTFAATATSGALAGDSFYLRNTGAGTFTASGTITAPTGHKLTCLPNEAFSADYDSVDDAWYSTTPSASGAGTSTGLAYAIAYVTQ